MLKLIRKLAGQDAPAPVSQVPRRKSAPGRDYSLAPPPPLPEVVEGNEASDWDLWQDSVDSQAMPLTSGTREFAPTAPATLEEEVDPFSRVSKNRDS